MKKIILPIISVILICSCTRTPQFDLLKEIQNKKNIKVSLSGRYWQSMYTPNNSFELKFTNSGEKSLTNCVIIINGRFKHELKGLTVKMNNENKYSVSENNTIRGNESVGVVFDQECGNFDRFHINANVFFKPQTISLISNKDTVEWLFDLPLRKSYF